MSRNTKSMAVLLLALSLGPVGGGRAIAATKTTKPAKKATTTRKVTTTKKGTVTTLVATTAAPATTTASKTTTAPTTASTPAAPAATTTAAPPVPAVGGITIQNFSFVNSPINAKAGVAIVITNLDSSDHTVSADDGSFSEGLGGNKTAWLTISTAGTFKFHCNIHPSMKGTIIVA